jgi:hypothetical protein
MRQQISCKPKISNGGFLLLKTTALRAEQAFPLISWATGGNRVTLLITEIP